MPVNAITMPYLLAVSITLSSRIEPPGCTIYCTPDLRARAQRYHQTGRTHPNRRSRPCFSQSTPSFPRRVSTSGLTLKVFCQTPSASTSSYSSDIYTSIALSRSGRRMPSTNCKPSTLGMLPQEPVVRLIARQSRAVDTALLACAYTDGHAILDIANRVGLRVLERNER